MRVKSGKWTEVHIKKEEDQQLEMIEERKKEEGGRRKKKSCERRGYDKITMDSIEGQKDGSLYSETKENGSVE